MTVVAEPFDSSTVDGMVEFEDSFSERIAQLEQEDLERYQRDILKNSSYSYVDETPNYIDEFESKLLVLMEMVRGFSIDFKMTTSPTENGSELPLMNLQPDNTICDVVVCDKQQPDEVLVVKEVPDSEEMMDFHDIKGKDSSNSEEAHDLEDNTVCESSLQVLSIYCAHMASKWNKILELRPRQSKDMSVEAYYDLFFKWKLKLDEVNYIGGEESFIDDFIYGLKIKLGMRVWEYKWKPRTLYGAFRRAVIEETMMNNDADMVLEEMPHPNSMDNEGAQDVSDDYGNVVLDASLGSEFTTKDSLIEEGNEPSKLLLQKSVGQNEGNVVDLQASFGSYGDLTVNGSDNGSTKAWYDEATPAIKIISRKCDSENSFASVNLENSENSESLKPTIERPMGHSQLRAGSVMVIRLRKSVFNTELLKADDLPLDAQLGTGMASSKVQGSVTSGKNCYLFDRVLNDLFCMVGNDVWKAYGYCSTDHLNLKMLGEIVYLNFDPGGMLENGQNKADRERRQSKILVCLVLSFWLLVKVHLCLLKISLNLCSSLYCRDSSFGSLARNANMKQNSSNETGSGFVWFHCQISKLNSNSFEGGQKPCLTIYEWSETSMLNDVLSLGIYDVDFLVNEILSFNFDPGGERAYYFKILVKEHEMTPSMEIYGYLVDMFGHGKAYPITLVMPIIPSEMFSKVSQQLMFSMKAYNITALLKSEISLREIVNRVVIIQGQYVISCYIIEDNDDLKRKMIGIYLLLALALALALKQDILNGASAHYYAHTWLLACSLVDWDILLLLITSSKFRIGKSYNLKERLITFRSVGLDCEDTNDAMRFKLFNADSELNIVIRNLIKKDIKPSPQFGLSFSTLGLEHYIWDPGSFAARMGGSRVDAFCNVTTHLKNGRDLYGICTRFKAEFLVAIGKYFYTTSVLKKVTTSTIFAFVTKVVGCGVASLEVGVVHVMVLCEKHSKQWYDIPLTISSPACSHWLVMVCFVDLLESKNIGAAENLKWYEERRLQRAKNAEVHDDAALKMWLQQRNEDFVVWCLLFGAHLWMMSSVKADCHLLKTMLEPLLFKHCNRIIVFVFHPGEKFNHLKTWSWINLIYPEWAENFTEVAQARHKAMNVYRLGASSQNKNRFSLKPIHLWISLFYLYAPVMVKAIQRFSNGSFQMVMMVQLLFNWDLLFGIPAFVITPP